MSVDVARRPIVSSHAARRWVERVSPGSSLAGAEQQILRFLEGAEENGRALVNPAWPGITLLLRDGTVTTALASWLES